MIKRKYEYYKKLLKAEDKERYILGLKEFGSILLLIPLCLLAIIITTIFAKQCFNQFGKYSMSGGFSLILAFFELLLLLICVLGYIECHSDEYILKQLSKLENEMKLVEKYTT